MKKVLIASENPVKINVAKLAFARVFGDEEFNFEGLKSESGVPDQPLNDETEQGALNRLNFIKAQSPEADFWLSQEGGVYTEENKMYNRAWIMVSDKSGYVAKASTALFFLPTQIAADLKAGLELGDANDKFFSSVNSKQGIGAIGHLTDGLISREDYYLQAAIIALSELKHQDWYK
jgi:inosine/xanthosine triphosphatase